MFAYSGLTRDEVQALRAHHVCTSDLLLDDLPGLLTWPADLNFDGRMSITGVNTKNVQYLAEAIHKVTNK